jgi:putative membrane protein
MSTGSRSGLAVVGLLLAFGPASAQQNPMDNPSVVQPPTQSGSNTPPIAGANSFSEGQARRLIESQGYSGVSPLVNDRQGIWHGTANKGAARVHVYVDYKGNVSARQE